MPRQASHVKEKTDVAETHKSPSPPSLPTIRVSYINADTGVGAFACQTYEPGDCVLRERPYVFAQSYRTWNTQPMKSNSICVGHDNRSVVGGRELRKCAATRTAAHSSLLNPSVQSNLPSLNSACSLSQSPPLTHAEAQQVDGRHNGCLECLQRVRCCFGCGAPLPHSLKEECGRLDRLSQLQRDSSSDHNSGGDEAKTLCTLNREGNTREVSSWELLHSTGISRYMNTDNKASSTADEAVREYVTEIDVTGAVHVVYFCGPVCEAQSLHEEGKRFVLTRSEGTATWLKDTYSEIPACQFLSPLCRESECVVLRYPAYETILYIAQHPTSVTTRYATWPSRLSVLSTLHSIARRCNERIWLLLLLLSKELHHTLSMTSSLLPHFSGHPRQRFLEEFTNSLEKSVAVVFRARLEGLCERYAEGAMRLLNADQKALLRFSWQLLTWWWVLCCLGTVEDGIKTNNSGSKPRQTPREILFSSLSASTAGAGHESVERWLGGVLRVAETCAFPLQIYLRLYWLSNANVHMYIVSSPLYALWCRWLASGADNRPHNDDQGAEGARVERTELFTRLYALFHGTNTWSATLQNKSAASSSASSPSTSPPVVSDVLHATGVALYDTATKLNHSCLPNVAFQPNAGAVEAAVVAVRHIDAGEEIFTSYTRPDEFGDVSREGEETDRQAAARRRRRYLQEHYGFVCNCPLCVDAGDGGDGSGNSRRILRVRGTDAHNFLHGIFTNDLRELHPSGSMYGCFLYFTGRVMCDAHLYQCKRVYNGQASILVDVDESSVEELLDHLSEMKMRKKVVIDNVGEDLAVVATLAHSEEAEMPTKTERTHESEPTQTLEVQHTECFADPRNAALFPPPPPKPKVSPDEASGPTDDAATVVGGDDGASSSPPSFLQPWTLKRCVLPLTWAPPRTTTDPYYKLLYSRGIGEGPAVFKHNKTLPFEGNLDFLKAVSFHKGCYVGQELTHRTHVMLVTRKRTVPLVFGSTPNPRPVEVGESLYSAEKEKIGEVTGVCGDVGVGLLRLRYVEKKSLTVPGLQLRDGVPVQMSLPDWWPRKEVKKLLKNNS